MQITSATSSSSNAGAGAGNASNINRLQKQLRDLTEELRGVASSDMDEKAKLLQSQIQMVQQQITALQRQMQQEQMDKAQAQLQQQQDARAARERTGSATVQPRRAGAQPGLGKSVNTFA